MTPFTIVLTGLALCLFAAPPAEAARSEYFGIAQGEALDARDLQGMARLRVRTDRFLIPWRSVERSRGSFEWGRIDKLVGDLASHGVRPVPFLWGSPRWAGIPGPSRPPVGSAFAKQSWREFLETAVGRYGPGGSYWANRYHQRFGAGATPLPVQSWQIWNEPNVTRYFDPRQSVGHAARKYALLLQISHDAIKSRDPRARIVLAGMLPNANSLAWDFLNGLYRVPGFKASFDVAALHPYARDLDQFQRAIEQFRGVMSYHGDRGTPLWLTEFGWGSAPPDSSGVNKSLSGQRQMLTGSLKLILRHRWAWNLQRVFWFLWRDPAPGSEYARLCSFCGTAGLLSWNRNQKPAYSAFRGFAAERTPPMARIASGPGQGSFTSDSTPSFSVTSNEPGSTFACRVETSAFKACGSRPTRRSPLSDGPHAFIVKAIDAPGNESTAVSRSFTVDTIPPAVTISSGPRNGSATSDRNTPFAFASNEPGSSFQCQLDGGGFDPCSSPYAANQLGDGQHTFRVQAIDTAGNRSHQLGSKFTVDTAAPKVTIEGRRKVRTRRRKAAVNFILKASEPADLRCRINSRRFRSCSSPYRTPKLGAGTYTLKVKATDHVGNVSTKRKRFRIVKKSTAGARRR